MKRLLHIALLLTGITVNADVEIFDAKDVYNQIEQQQVAVQKTIASASNYITGGDVLSANCLSDFSISGGVFNLPDLDSLINSFLDKICDYADQALNDAVGNLNASLSVPLDGVNTPLGHIPSPITRLPGIARTSGTRVRQEYAGNADIQPVSLPDGLDILNHVGTSVNKTGRSEGNNGDISKGFYAK